MPRNRPIPSLREPWWRWWVWAYLPGFLAFLGGVLGAAAGWFLVWLYRLCSENRVLGPERLPRAPVAEWRTRSETECKCISTNNLWQKASPPTLADSLPHLADSTPPTALFGAKPALPLVE